MGKTTERVALEMSREQAMIVERACELFARLKIGQFEQIIEQMMDFSTNDASNRSDIADDLLKIVACLIFGKNTWGMPNVEKDDEHERAWEVYTALRYTRCCHDYPEEIGKSWSVCFDEPRSYSGDGVPKCEILSTAGQK